MEEKFHTQHQPVLLSRVLEYIAPLSGQCIVDATLGGGGYTEALLSKVLPGGKIIALDWDKNAIEKFHAYGKTRPEIQKTLEEKNLILARANFADLDTVLAREGIGHIDGLVADLGLSSDQLADPERGLSFQNDGPLDMRLNSDEKITAGEIVNSFSEEDLNALFRIYGDEPEAKRIARAIVWERKKEPLSRTQELASLIGRTVSLKRRFGRIHPATQVFQALRIAVNSERPSLEKLLAATLTAVVPGGKIAIVSFHSGEDAVVKHFFQENARGCTCGLVPCICGKRAMLRILTKKPVLPSEEEIRGNPRARSAKLRVAERIQ